jgi:hypothetical protein
VLLCFWHTEGLWTAGGLFLADCRESFLLSAKAVANALSVFSAYSSRKVLFHRELMRDFLANIGRPTLHKKAVVAYLESLASSKAVG